MSELSKETNRTREHGDERFALGRIRKAARSELGRYLSLCGDPPATTCALLVRAWHALASWEATVRGDSPQSAVEFAQSLASGERGQLPPMLRGMEAGFVAAVLEGASASILTAKGPPERELFEHRRLLVRAYSDLARHARRGRPGLGFRWYWAVAGALAIAAGASIVYAVARPRWRVSYYPNASLSGTPAVVTLAVAPDRNWGRQAGPGAGLPADNFSARFETCLVLSSAANVVFTIGSDDGAKLFIDNRQIISAWINQPYTVHEQAVQLDRGAHALRLEYYQNTEEARLSFAARINHSTSSLKYRLPRLREAPCGP